MEFQERRLVYSIFLACLITIVVILICYVFDDCNTECQIERYEQCIEQYPDIGEVACLSIVLDGE